LFHLFGEFDLSQAYAEEELLTKDDVLEALGFEQAAASAKRFSLLLEFGEELSDSGRYLP